MTDDSLQLLALSVFVTLTFFLYLYYRIRRFTKLIDNHHWFVGLPAP